MLESLKDLDHQLKQKNVRLHLFFGNMHKIIEELITKEEIESVHFKPQSNTYSNYYSMDTVPDEIEDRTKEDIYNQILETHNPRIYSRGGRSQCLKILKNMKKNQDYPNNKDYPAKEATTGLSAHNKLGTCSIREIYHTMKENLGNSSPLLRQLYWRDFFTYIVYHFPHVFKQPFQHKFRRMVWKRDPEKFRVWCNGKTGFPIVDAGMRQLNITGFMHNRVRLIVASFLTKDLHPDWKLGERYFAERLVDYDPCVNNGNWQWAASVGCDAQPYLRIFNPWLQQKKFDPQCIYIKRFVPELMHLPPKAIHEIYKNYRHVKQELDYPRPIVDHESERKIAMNLYAVNNSTQWNKKNILSSSGCFTNLLILAVSITQTEGTDEPRNSWQ
jgi:deoxyribodipyrimidine photo-lyase